MSRSSQCNCKYYLLNLHFVNIHTLLVRFSKQFQYLSKDDFLILNNLIKKLSVILSLTGSKRKCPQNSKIIRSREWLAITFYSSNWNITYITFNFWRLIFDLWARWYFFKQNPHCNYNCF